VLRSARLLNDKAPLEFCVARQRDEMDEAVRAMLRQKQQRFEQARVPGFETDRDKYDFFNEGTYLFAEKQMVVLFYLKAGDLILATNWGLVAGRRFHGIMTSFEGGDWAKFSPGSILNYRVVEWLHREGFEWHDLGVGDEPWKLKAARAFNLSQRRSAATFNGWIYLQRRAAMVRLRATQFWQTIRPLKWIFLRRLRQSTLALLGIDILLDVVLAVLATA
jgi:CelD/BcsL family acetyltransferase involved in cellulose biosynthesis